MIIDTHCHYDMMPNPEAFILENEKLGNIIIGMTNCPQHFEMGYYHIRNFKRIRLALGFHPQITHEIIDQLPLFKRLINKTSYIGEIGLDFSKQFIGSKKIQIDCLHEILSSLRGEKKILSVHSRLAEDTLLNLLREYNIENVIFHWYSGKLSLIQKIIDCGYYFSINEAMSVSENGKKIITRIPHDRILTETDAPFNQKCNINETWKNISINESVIENNFRTLISRIY